MINPIGMTAVDWANRMALFLPQVVPMIIYAETEWKNWARHVIQHPDISKYNPPNPDSFDDWVLWAQRFNQSVPVN